MRYVGEDMVWHNLIPQIDQELKNGQYYDVQVSSDGPQMMVNGQPIVHPNSSVIVSFRNGVSIPYAPNLFHLFWEG